jgi:flagellar basal body-associated protein FliL
MPPAPPPPPPAGSPSADPLRGATAPGPSGKKGLSSGAVVAIVIGILVGVLALLLLVVLVGGSFWMGKGRSEVVSVAPESPGSAQVPLAEKTPDAQTPANPPDAAAPIAGDATLVTDAEARDVVTKFINLRIAGDIAGSKALCSKNMLSGEFGDYVNDKYWKPDSFEITKTATDKQFIHVTTFGIWPSGREPTIYSVFRDPATGKVVIDGLIFDEP